MPRPKTSPDDVADGRENTDRSLKAERAKTDSSLVSERAALEGKTDRAIGRGREMTDQQRAKRRADADAATRTERRDGSISRETERRHADARVEAERTAADSAMRAERAHADLTTAHERAGLKASERAKFRAERELTDRDLARERELTDRAAGIASALYELECRDHRNSQVALGLRDQFLALLSNDLKKPMLTISVAADRLRRRVDHEGADDDDRLQVDTIARSSLEVLRLIGDLLERVALWNSPETAARGPRRQKRSGQDRRVKQVAATKTKSR